MRLRSKILSWGKYPGLSEWPSVITRVLQMGQHYLAAKNQRETAVRERLDGPLLVLMRTKRMVKAGKVKETDPSTEPPEGALSTP